eukprot:scaffold18792_cov30-Tisochrysis_lutea.AAC.2
MYHSLRKRMRSGHWAWGHTEGPEARMGPRMPWRGRAHSGTKEGNRARWNDDGRAKKRPRRGGKRTKGSTLHPIEKKLLKMPNC